LSQQEQKQPHDLIVVVVYKLLQLRKGALWKGLLDFPTNTKLLQFGAIIRRQIFADVVELRMPAERYTKGK